MGLAISEEHAELARMVQSFIEARGGRLLARSFLDIQDPRLPAFWSDIAAAGWLGLHIPEELGGEGFGLAELAVVIEVLGRVVAPGPVLPTTITSAVLARFGLRSRHSALVAALVSGTKVAAIGLHGSVTCDADGTLDGDAGLVLGADVADVLVLACGPDLVVVERDLDGVDVASCQNLDPTRRVGRVRCSAARVATADLLRGSHRYALSVGRALAAAEAAGGAQACTEMATQYAKDRIQFGRPIGTFQAIKHHCANMLVASELATATAWEAARVGHSDEQAELAALIASSIALPGFLRCAQLNIQVHGGIGFTWEHDAHLFLRRAGALAAVFGRADDAAATVTRLMQGGLRRVGSIDLPPEAEKYRSSARSFAAQYQGTSASQRRETLVDSGYLMPHWPMPWGRDAGPVEQLIIDEELAGIERPTMGIGGWVTLTLIQHGTPEQLERWIRPSLIGTLRWCQLFSEPGAGSDAAAISTRGTRTGGGWMVNGQKVWTSGAQHANRGIATVRTEPDAPKHSGITMMTFDMTARGVEVRPLRDISGNTTFNEVFFEDAFVPDADVVGEVNTGWEVARSTFANERVAIASEFGAETGHAIELLELLAEEGTTDTGYEREIGSLLAEETAMELLRLRQVQRAVAGARPGPEGSIGKLLAGEHSQRVANLGLRVIGERGAVIDATRSRMVHQFLFTAGLTIAGGTSEIVRNQIAERILGLPRDPLMR